MKSLKTKQAIIILVISIAMLSFGTALAKKVQIAKPQNSAISTSVKLNTNAAVRLKFACDLEVRHIAATQCFCNEPLGNVDSMLYKNIWVTVGNYTCPDGKGASNVKAFLDVEYYNIMENRLVSATFPVTLDKNETKQIKVKNGFVLIRQNPGIKATIRMGTNNPAVVDCNNANNRKIARRCQLPLVY